ncbi:MAG: hypothetical protein ACJAVN_002070 [Roseivirga sp.]|jgi:hypothetical protein
MKQLISQFLVCILCTACVWSCGSRHNVIQQGAFEEGIIFVDPKKASITPFSRIFKDLSLVELKSPNEFNLAIISKVVIDGDAIYALDKVFSRRINKYNLAGELQSSFSVYDSDTLDLLNLDDFFIDKGTLYVLDSEGKQAFQLTPELKVKKRFSFNFSANKLAVEANNFHLFRNEFAFNLEDERYFYNYISTDFNGKISYKKYPFTIELGTKLRLSVKESFSSSTNNIHYTKWLNDTIFRTNKKGLEAKYFVDFGDKGAGKYSAESPETIKEKLLSDPSAFASGVSFFLDEKDFLSFQYVFNGKPQSFFLNKDSGSSYITNFLSFGGNFVPFPVDYSNGTLIAAIDEYQIEQGFYNKLKGIDLYDEVVNNGLNYVVTFKVK